MEECANCGMKSNDPALFTGNNPPVCITCHLALLEEDRSYWQEVVFVPHKGFTKVNSFGNMNIFSTGE